MRLSQPATTAVFQLNFGTFLGIWSTKSAGDPSKRKQTEFCLLWILQPPLAKNNSHNFSAFSSSKPVFQILLASWSWTTTTKEGRECFPMHGFRRVSTGQTSRWVPLRIAPSFFRPLKGTLASCWRSWAKIKRMRRLKWWCELDESWKRIASYEVYKSTSRLLIYIYKNVLLKKEELLKENY